MNTMANQYIHNEYFSRSTSIMDTLADQYIHHEYFSRSTSIMDTWQINIYIMNTLAGQQT